jgi:hypothetical protein
VPDFVAERLSWIGEIHLRAHAETPRVGDKLQSEHSFLNSNASGEDPWLGHLRIADWSYAA